MPHSVPQSVISTLILLIVSLLARINWRTKRRSSLTFAEYRPCRQFACRIRSMPSRVRGPVLFPPCILHLPLSIPNSHRRAQPLFLRRISSVHGVSPHFFSWVVPPPIWLSTTPTMAWPPAPTLTCSTVTFCWPLFRYLLKVSNWAV